VKVDPAAALTAKLPADAAGKYVLEVLMAGPGGQWEPKARAAFIKSLPVVIGPVPDASGLRARLAKNKDATAEYTLTLLERADRGEVNPHRLDLAQELKQAAEILAAREGGRDPFAGRKGDLRRAYRSSVDQTAQPYRLFVPQVYDGKQARPLVVALHGMGGDENSFFDQYAQGEIKKQAERLGYLVVCPKGRGPASMYRGDAEKDVMEVLAEVEREYRIDGKRIYLMGHSMGGFGTWSIAMNHPERFAALGPVAGGGNPARLEAIKHIPHFVVHGDADKTVPVTQSRAMVEAAKKLGIKVEYVEVPGGSHSAIVVPNLAPMFDFFQAQARVAADR
jgi:predicted esterase